VGEGLAQLTLENYFFISLPNWLDSTNNP